MSVLPSSNVVNVTIQTTPSGLTEKNVNSLALFTNEPSNNISPFGIYITASQVIEDYGTSSVTAQMASAIFSQSPNILSGDGRLVIVPMQAAVSATSGKTVTSNISANLSNLIGCAAGDLKVTINGVVANLTGLNFTNCVTLVDVAAVINARLVDAILTANATTITFTSTKVGTVSTMAIAAVSGGTGIDLSAVGYLNATGSTPTAGVNSSGETLQAADVRAKGQVGYAGVMTNVYLEDTIILTNANYFEAQDVLYFQHVSSTQDVLGIATQVQQASDRQTRILPYTAGQAAANLYKAAYAGRGMSVDFSGSNTSSTMNLKSLATIDPDLGISQTLYTLCLAAGCDPYVSYDGVPAVYSTGGNDFFDNPYSDLALKFALEAAGFNYLRQTNTKIPQTESGMSGLKDAYNQVMQQFVRNGCIAAGTWNAPDTFGDPQLFRQNIAATGYYIYSTPIALQSAEDRDARKAPLVQIALKRAGAIHTSNVIVTVNN